MPIYKTQYKDNPIIDILFWVSIVFYIDPGGYLTYYLNGRIFGLHYQFTFVTLAYICFFLRFKNPEILINENKEISGYIWKTLLWFMYYLLIYGWLNTSYVDLPFQFITRGFRVIFQGFIVIPIIYFAIIRLKLFLNLLTWSTIFILLLYVASVITGGEYVPFMSGDRGFLNATRYFMYGYGIIYFLIPLSFAYLFSRYKPNLPVLMGGILVSIMIFISITRRYIVGLFEYYLIILIIFTYIEHGKLFKGIRRVFSLRNIGFFLLFLFVLSLLFSEYLDFAIEAAKESYNVMVYGKTSSGAQDVRMSLFGKVGIVDAIRENFWFGTGFDPAWGTGDGGKNEWEGSDYIFLSAFAMYGLIGLLIFLPFYLIAFKVLRNFISLIRDYRNLIYTHKNLFELPVIIGIAAASEFIKNIIEYPNWFYPIGATGWSPQYFIFFGLLLGSYFTLKYNLQLFAQNSNKNT
ncbi:MAG: hypothetical protein K9G76_00210 [Bacteroidales bacterium]|nr:hypothetical protein [Bacteroidales bacterium]MCF8402534.1 hypothetical protein [Bacteroidales bacterium]